MAVLHIDSYWKLLIQNDSTHFVPLQYIATILKNEAAAAMYLYLSSQTRMFLIVSYTRADYVINCSLDTVRAATRFLAPVSYTHLDVYKRQI